MDSFWILVALMLNLLIAARPTMSPDEYRALEQRSNDAIRSGEEAQVQIIVDELQH